LSQGRIKMVIVGAGLWGEAHAGILGMEPKAICDLNLEKANELAAGFGQSI